MTRIGLIVTVFALGFGLTPANALIDPFEGLEMATIEVEGVSHVFPVGDTERKNDIYFLKKGLAGDEIAMEMFLGGAEERHFFIGREFAKWLVVRKDSLRVIDFTKRSN